MTKTKPDNFSPRIVEKGDDYVRVEYESPILGVAPRYSRKLILGCVDCTVIHHDCPFSVQFVDDVEFWFPPGKKSIVQYRSASRSGFIDFDTNKKRVKARDTYHYLILSCRIDPNQLRLHGMTCHSCSVAGAEIGTGKEGLGLRKQLLNMN